MKNKIIFCLSIVLMGFSSLQAVKNESLLSKEPKIFINNRILARVNGKPISTYDLMKKMDLTFYRQFPQYASSAQARHQFYEMSWKHALSEIIDKELILADGQESKIEVSTGDIRQEIENSFGPNVIANLDKSGITFDEASKMMQEEIVIRRLVAGRVHSKAIRRVTPNKVRLAYEEYIKNPDHARPAQWSYRIITIKDRTLQKTEETAKNAYQLLLEGVPFDQLSAQLKERKLLGKKANVNVSNLLKHNDKEISNEYRDILVNLEKGMFSQPFSHKSRTNQSTVFRILTIDEKIPGGVPSFKEMEGSLKEKLIDQEIDRETDTYLLNLREHYHIRQNDLDAYLPANYQPFLLK